MTEEEEEEVKESLGSRGQRLLLRVAAPQGRAAAAAALALATPAAAAAPDAGPTPSAGRRRRVGAVPRDGRERPVGRVRVRRRAAATAAERPVGGPRAAPGAGVGQVGLRRPPASGPARPRRPVPGGLCQGSLGGLLVEWTLCLGAERAHVSIARVGRAGGPDAEGLPREAPLKSEKPEEKRSRNSFHTFTETLRVGGRQRHPEPPRLTFR